MAWNDGSRFLVAHGVKWGTGPKFYKGSKHDTYWNKVSTHAVARFCRALCIVLLCFRFVLASVDVPIAWPHADTHGP